MERRSVAITAAVILPLILCGIPYAYAAPAAAATFFGPSFEVTSTSPGGPVYLIASTASGSTFVAPPSGSGTPCSSAEVCSFPLEACTNPATFFYSIREVTITDPNGNGYELGSSAIAGMFWPPIYGGPAPSPNTLPLSDGIGNLGDALNLTLGDSFVLPFGAGAGGFTFTTSLGSPPETHSPEGAYYWWTTPGNVYGADKRLDQNPSINPTATSGTYLVDIKGYAVCSSLVPFDFQANFTEGSTHLVPQFTAPVAAMVAVTFIAVALLRKKSQFAI